MITMIKLSKWFASRDSEMFKMLKSLFHIIWLFHGNSYLMPSDNSPEPKLKYIWEKLLKVSTMDENCKIKQNLYLIYNKTLIIQEHCENCKILTKHEKLFNNVISAEKLQKLNKTRITK